MQVAILKTDGGPHPAEKWARVTAWQIVNHLISIDENSSTPLAQEMRSARDELEFKLMRTLKAHHETVQNGERAALSSEGVKRLAKREAVSDHIDIDKVCDAVADEAKFHPELAAHFLKDETRTAVAEVLRSHFHSVLDIERSWHADRNSDTTQAKSFRAARHVGFAG